MNRTPDTGFDQAPPRYMARGRETIDRQRDEAHTRARAFLGEDPRVDAWADELFAFHCDQTATKYADRLGLKEGTDPTRDAEAARWYREMATHVRGGGPDPRHARPGFVPYTRPLPPCPEPPMPSLPDPSISAYLTLALRTERVLTPPGEGGLRLLHSAIGMMTEIAEVQEALDPESVQEELGDILWYWALGLSVLKISPPGFLTSREIDAIDETLRNPLCFQEVKRGAPLSAAICTWGDLVRRHVIHGKAQEAARARDVLYVVWRELNVFCRAVHLDPEVVMRTNLAKLQARFPDRYDGDRFDARDLAAERAAMTAATSGREP